MSFSIKWLFAVVAIAAVFAAAFTVQNHWWANGIVGLTLSVLLAAVVGLSLGLLYKPFWLSFCIVGWAYLLVSFSVADFSRLAAALPTTRGSFEIWSASHPIDPESNMRFLLDRPDISRYSVLLGAQSASSHQGEQFYNFLNIVHCLFTLVFAFLAGVIASYCVRRSKLSEHQ